MAQYTVDKRPKSDLYRDLIPAVNGGLVELLDPATGPTQARVVSQLLALERHASRQGKDLIAHPRNGHDDVINATAGALLLALSGARSFGFIEPSVHRVDSTRGTHRGPDMDTRGTRHLGGDVFMAKNGPTARAAGVRQEGVHAFHPAARGVSQRSSQEAASDSGRRSPNSRAIQQ